MNLPSQALALHSLARSNMPVEQKTGIMKFYESVFGNGSAGIAVSHPIREGFHAIRKGGEAAFTGLALGSLDSALGGLDYKGYPIDGIIAALGFGGALLSGGDPTGIATDMSNVASDALAILAYRKTKAWRDGVAKQNGRANGEDDPIAVAAKEFA